MSDLGGYDRPVPVPDETTAGFWAAVGQHRLAFQRCDHCGTFAHPPASFCLACHELDKPSFSFVPVSGRGTVVNWTVIAQPGVAGFTETGPLVHVLVRMEEQEDLLFPATLIGDSRDLTPGAPVETVIQDVAPGVSLPYFQLLSRNPDPAA